MRYYKLILLFGLFAWTFASCNTDDLEKDINALKDRVTSMETQVKQLNDEMNIIRVLLDGNKTITDYSMDGDTYTLTLSNGEKLTLTPGVVGGNYPSIEIGDNGNWVIGGKDTGWRAEAENGVDATITPQFKIEANPADGNKKYWWVSYDNGTTWAVLENGLAEGTNTQSNPISAAVVDGDNFKVTLNGQIYYIPIVKSLECAINAPEGMTDGFWTVAAAGGASSFTVKVNIAKDDLVRVNAPAAWNVQLSNYTTGTTEVTVNVTPPSTPSECVIVVEVTHGVNTATDQIKAKTSTDSYWAEYQAGFDIRIGDVVINKFTYKNAELISAANVASFTKFETDKVYFIDTDVTPTVRIAIQDYLILINNNPLRPAIVKFEADKYIPLNSKRDTALGFLCKNLIIDCKSNANYISTFEGTGTCAFENFIMDGCTIKMGKEGAGRSIFSIYSGSNKTSTIKKFILESCHISLTNGSIDSKIFNLHSNNPTFTNSRVLIRNNVFYSEDAETAVELKLFVYANAVTSFSVERNTFTNVIPNSTQAYIQTIPDTNSLLAKNIVWNGGTWSQDCCWISSKKDLVLSLDKKNFEDNLIFDKNVATKWVFFRSNYGLPSGIINVITPLVGTPFESMDFTTGTFILNGTYKGKYGSDIK